MTDIKTGIQPANPIRSVEAAAAVHLMQNRGILESLHLIVQETGITTGSSAAWLYLVDSEFKHKDNPLGLNLISSWNDDTCRDGQWPEDHLLTEIFHAIYPEPVYEFPVMIDRQSPEKGQYLQFFGLEHVVLVPILSSGVLSGLMVFGAQAYPERWGERFLPELKSAGDIIGTAVERDRIRSRLEKRSRSFLRLNTLTRTALEESDLSGMLKILSGELKEMLGADWSHIFVFPSGLPLHLPDSNSGDVDTELTFGDERDLPWVLHDLQSISAFPDLYIENAQGNRWREEPGSKGTLLALPIMDANDRYGLAVLQFTKIRKFTIEEMALCDQAVKQIVLGMTRAALMVQLEELVEKRTRNLAEALDRMKKENSERAQAERQRQASEKQLLSVTQSAPLGIIMLNGEGIVEYWNPAAKRIFGFSSDRIIGSSMEVILEPDAHQQFWTHIDQKYVAGSHIGSDILALEGISASGKTIPLELSVGTWNQDNNHFYTVIIRDASREQEIRHWVDRQGQFAFVGKLASGVAQDFSTILSAIILYAELLESTSQLSEKERNYVEMILQQSRRAASLSAQILDVENLTGEVQKPLNLIPFIEKVSHLVERTSRENSAICFIHRDEDYTISVDENSLRQVVLDLAFQLRDSLSEGEAIDIAVSREHVSLNTEPGSLNPGEWIAIQISGENFDPVNFPGTAPLNQSVQGYSDEGGLGFSQLISIVERQNGVLSRLLTDDGQLCFRLYFPALTISENLEPGGEFPQNIDTPEKPPAILVVEDEDVSRRVVCEILASQGYRVLDAENGKRALELFRNHKVDLIITDIIMPEMGGIALINEVHKQCEHLEVLIMSGYPLGEGPGELLNSEDVRWLKKPISTSTLTRAAAEALNRQLMYYRTQ